MDYVTNLEDSFDIIIYALSQLKLPSLSEYYIYLLIAAFFFAALFIITKFIQKIRSPNEYIKDGICLKITLPPMGDQKEVLSRLIKKLHVNLQEKFKHKQFFCFEVLVKSSASILFLYIPKVVYESLPQSIFTDLEVSDVTKFREDFCMKFEGKTLGLDMDLSLDFVFPLKLEENGKNLNLHLRNDKWIFMQLCQRPIDIKWLKVLERYIFDLKKGKDPRLATSGCVGGFVNTLFPFLNFWASIITEIFHSSSAKDLDQKREVIKISKKSKRKIELINIKKNVYGFETKLRLVVKNNDEVRSYKILDKILDRITSEAEDVNTYGVEKLYKRVNRSFKNDILLANLDKSSLDILNSSEIVDLISRFL